MKQIEILPYADELGVHFKTISYQWIEKYFGIEDKDRELLENHRSKIIDEGGHILFAKMGDEVVGACALINHRNGHYELAKMGVLEGYQGQGIGRKLAEAIVSKAREIGAKKVFLESSQELEAALALYHKLGFRNDPSLEVPAYSRCNVQLALPIIQDD